MCAEINWHIKDDAKSHVPADRLESEMREWAEEVCLGLINDVNLLSLRYDNPLALIALREHVTAGRIDAQYVGAEQPDQLLIFPTPALHTWWKGEACPSYQDNGYLGLSIDPSNRLIQRCGYGNPVDLSRRPGLWHIFKKLIHAGADGSNRDDILRDYPGEKSAVHQARSELNDLLLPLQIRIEERKWRLIEDKPDLRST